MGAEGVASLRPMLPSNSVPKMAGLTIDQSSCAASSSSHKSVTLNSTGSTTEKSPPLKYFTS